MCDEYLHYISELEITLLA